MEEKEIEFTEADEKMLKKLMKKQLKMSKRDKKNKNSKAHHSSNESSSDGEEEKHHKKRDLKQKVKQEAKDEILEQCSEIPKPNENGDIVFDINSRKKVQVRMYRGRTLVDIREFFQKDGKDLPTKKGIALNEEIWKALKEAIPEIDKAIEKFK